MREEEKLARDVYQTLYEKWGLHQSYERLITYEPQRPSEEEYNRVVSTPMEKGSI
nr:DUF2202 domain-containing protein [Archaeoglobus neptunius]